MSCMDPSPARSCFPVVIAPCPWDGSLGAAVCGRLCLPRGPSSWERRAWGAICSWFSAALPSLSLCLPPSACTSRAGNLLGSALSSSSWQARREELNHSPGDQPASHGPCLQQSQTSRCFCCPLCPLEGGIPPPDTGAPLPAACLAAVVAVGSLADQNQARRIPVPLAGLTSRQQSLLQAFGAA